MRSRSAVLAALLLAAATGACTKTPAPAPPAPIWQPAVGTCHDGFTHTLSEASYLETACTEPHTYETYHVGQSKLDSAEPPEPGTPEHKDLWAWCEAEFDSYIGGDWRERQLRLRVAFPKAAAWKQGARWFACEATTLFLHGAETKLTASIKDGFASLTDLAYGCAQVSSGISQRKRCDEPHNAEYVAHFPAELDYAGVAVEVSDQESLVWEQCLDEVRRFTGERRGGWLTYPSADDWAHGDNHMRCFLWTGDEKVSRSLKAGAA